MGFKKLKELQTGNTGEYWNIYKVSDIIKKDDKEQATMLMRCYKDEDSYKNGLSCVSEERVSVEYDYDKKMSREDWYAEIKKQNDFFGNAEDVI